MICWDNGTPNQDKWRGYIEKAVKILGEHRDEFDGLIACGMSGVLVAAPVALQLDVPLAIVRQKGDPKGHAHSFLGAVTRAIFVDDHFGGGNTFRHCREALTKYNPDRPCDADVKHYESHYGVDYCHKNHPSWYKAPPEREIVGIYMYNEAGGRVYYGYHTPGPEATARINHSYNLWPADVFKKLQAGSTKGKVKRIVKPARDTYGRFTSIKETASIW